MLMFLLLAPTEYPARRQINNLRRVHLRGKKQTELPYDSHTIWLHKSTTITSHHTDHLILKPTNTTSNLLIKSHSVFTTIISPHTTAQ